MSTRILVIDDHPSILEMLKLMLEWEGFEVILCAHSNQAQEYAEKSKPNLIMLDLMMPKPNGWEVLDGLRHNKFTIHIPIILMSAAPTQQSAAQVSATKWQNVFMLSKPFDNDVLLETIQRLLINNST